MALVSTWEVEEILKSMQRDKISGPDGWTVEFFQHLFDIIGDELTGWLRNLEKKDRYMNLSIPLSWI